MNGLGERTRGYPLRGLLAKLGESDRRQLEAAHLEAQHRGSLPALLTHLTDATRVDDVLASLPDASHSLLVALLISGGQAPMDTVHSLDGVSPALAGLAATGWLYLVRSEYYRLLYVLPNELFAPLWDRLLVPQDFPIYADAESPRQIPEAGYWTPFWHDVMMVLGELRREPLPLTRELHLYKRVESRLLAGSWLQGDESASAHLLMVRAFGQAVHIMDVDPYRRVLELGPAAGTFLAQDAQALWDALWDFAESPNGHNDPARLVLRQLLTSLPPDRWIQINKLNSWMRRLSLSAWRPEHVGLILQEWITLGLVEWDAGSFRLSDVGYAATHEHCAPLTSGQAVLEATGEILVPPETSLGERWAIDRYADLVQNDRMSIYRLTPASVDRAIDGGLNLEAILAHLGEVSRTPVPQNVAVNIEDWYRAASRHQFMEVTLLHSESAEASRQVASQLGDALLFRLSERDLVVRPDDVGAIRHQLARSGTAVRRQVMRPHQATPAGNPAPHRGARPTRQILAVSLPKDNGQLEPLSLAKLESHLQEAIRLQIALWLEYVPTGGGEPVLHQILPSYISNGWLQGWMAESGNPVAVPLTQIVRAGPTP